jgi:DNA-binding MarR family transcriptional regulator
VSFEITRDRNELQKTTAQVLDLLSRHGCLKFSTIRDLLQADRFHLKAMMNIMEERGLIEYRMDEHYKFSGYSLPTLDKKINDGLDAFDRRPEK